MLDAKNLDRWCFTWDPTDVPGSGVPKAALIKKNKWAKGSVINVGFLDGDATVQGRIKAAVSEWTAPDTAQLRFVFVKDASTADVRITFKRNGSWSVIGTSCRSVEPDQPTMNYGWLNEDTDNQELRRVVLHEFGHALGLIHEHQNPKSAIPWNEDQVRKDLMGPPNCWSEAVVQTNMFEAYSKEETNGTKVDTKSIMMYPIPASWVTDPKFVAGLNDDLSPTDRTFIHTMYPK